MNLLNKLKYYKRRQEFHPGFLGIFTNPFYIARKGLLQQISFLSGRLHGSILDVGCGSKPYRELFTYSEYIGIDIENPGHDHSAEEIDIFYDGKNLPFPNSRFDNVLCNQVLEHVFEPSGFLTEINRVLKENGSLLMTVPFIWDEHEQPNDYARYSSFGLKYLLEKHGFEIVQQQKSVNHAGAICQLINAYTFKTIKTKNRRLNFLIILFLMAPFNIMGEILRIILPNNNDMYLDNILLAKKRKND